MTKTTSHDQSIQEDYIDIDPNYMSTRSNAPSRRNSREFEFKLYANPQERCSDDSPADELFYKGILLPLHLHPRIQIIQQLLLHERNPHYSDREEDELKKETMNTYYYASEGYEDSVMPEQCGTKNAWSKKFRGLGNSSLCSKLKSLFAKPTFFNDWCQTSKLKDYANNSVKRGRKSIVGRDQSSLKSSTEREKLIEEDELVHRKSFSSAVKLRPATRLNYLYTNSSPSSCSSSLSNLSCPRPNSNEFYISSMQPPAMRRSRSVNSEMESSIQGAITYCKKSQDIVSGRKSVSNIGSYF
jgi:hypothetical protein